MDKNLFYRVQRSRLREPLKRNLEISSTYKRNGIFNNEATTQGYGYVSEKSDKNIFYRRLKSAKRVPILLKRVFKDLDPQSRAIGSLDLTKEERRAGAVLEGIEATRDLIDNFIKTPKLKPDGSPVLDLSNKPEYEHRSLQEVLEVSQAALFESLKANNVVPNANLTLIIYSFTSNEIKFVLDKFQSIMENDPAILQNVKSERFKTAILLERLKDMLPVRTNKLNDAVAAEVVNQNVVPEEWDAKETEGQFEFQGYTPEQWDANQKKQIYLNAFVAGRINRTMYELRSIHNVVVQPRMMGLFFSMGHVLDLDTLRFYKREDSAGILANPHPLGFHGILI